MQNTSNIPLQPEGQTLGQGQTTPGHPVNPVPDLSSSQMPIHGPTIYNNNIPIARAPPGFETGFEQQVARGDSSKDIDQICDENIQLFLRCDQYKQKEEELKNTVEDLEKQVAETKRKCAEISSRLEFLRRQKAVR